MNMLGFLEFLDGWMNTYIGHILATFFNMWSSTFLVLIPN